MLPTSNVIEKIITADFLQKYKWQYCQTTVINRLNIYKMKKTAITQAIEHIAELREKLTSSSQILGITQAMDILEDYKKIEKDQITTAYNRSTYQFANDAEAINPLPAKDYFIKTYTQSLE